MGGAGVRSMARLNSAHEVRAVAGVLLLSEVRARCRLGGVIVVECYCFLKEIIVVVRGEHGVRNYMCFTIYRVYFQHKPSFY